MKKAGWRWGPRRPSSYHRLDVDATVVSNPKETSMGHRPYFLTSPSPITNLRKRFDLSEAELARILGITSAQLAFYEEHTRRVADNSLACMTMKLMLAPSLGFGRGQDDEIPGQASRKEREA